MSKLPDELKPVVQEFLEQVGQSLGNNGCNDWEFTKEQCKAGREFLGMKKRKRLSADFDVLAIVEKALGFDVKPDDYDEDE